MTDEASRRQASAQGETYHRILAAYDGSENARRALRRAIEIAKASAGDLFTVSAADSTRFTAYPMVAASEVLRDQVVQQTTKLMEEASALAKEQRVKSTIASFGEGHPADVILTQALRNKVDLIVAGRRSIKGVERFMMGSVSSAIVSRSECDVLIAK